MAVRILIRCTIRLVASADSGFRSRWKCSGISTQPISRKPVDFRTSASATYPPPAGQKMKVVLAVIILLPGHRAILHHRNAAYIAKRATYPPPANDGDSDPKAFTRKEVHVVICYIRYFVKLLFVVVLVIYTQF
jgi:hypothetical protein